MRKLNPVLDSCNDSNVKEFVDADMRNHLAFLELASYNKTKKFLYKHPLLKRYQFENDLELLRRKDPEKFMSDLIKADQNITRYRSLISNNKYKDEEEKNIWLNLIGEYQEKLSIMQRLISQ